MQRLIRSWPARFALFAILFAVILVPAFPALTAASLWSAGLGCAMAVAVGSLRLAAIARRDQRLVEHASNGSAPRDGEVVAVCGTIEAEGETLRSPTRGETCLAYTYSAFHFIEQKRLGIGEAISRTELKKRKSA